MVSDNNGDRVHPVLLTAYPSSSNQGRSNAIWLERPTPSVPSIAIKCPGSRFSDRYGNPYPYHFLAWLCSDMVSFGTFAVIVMQHHVLNDLAEHPLLFRNFAGRVDRAQRELVGQLVVEFEYPALENTKTLGGICRQPNVHAGLVIFEFGTSREQAPPGDLDGTP